MSSYSNQYPSFRNNQNPYVFNLYIQIKPVEQYLANPTKIGSTIYRSQFNAPNSPPSDSGRRPDNLRGGQPWTGSTTYKNIFNPPKSSSVNSKEKSMGQTDSLNPEKDYKHQYGTNILK